MKPVEDALPRTHSGVAGDRFQPASPADFGGGLLAAETIDQQTLRSFALWYVPAALAAESRRLDLLAARIAAAIGVTDRRVLKTYGMHFGASGPSVRVEMSREPRLIDAVRIQAGNAASLSSSLAWLDQVAAVLDRVGAASGLAHGAVSPFWVRLAADGTPRLDGFSFAAAFADADAFRPEDVWFTSPARRQKLAPDPADDVFGVAALAFWALAGGGATEQLPASGIERGAIDQLRKLRGLPPTGWRDGWDESIVAGLSVTPSLRPPTPTALTSRLRARLPEGTDDAVVRSPAKIVPGRRAPPWRDLTHRSGNGNGARESSNGTDAVSERIGQLRRLEQELAGARKTVETDLRENALQRARLEADLAAVAGSASGVEASRQKIAAADLELRQKLRELQEKERAVSEREQATAKLGESIRAREASVTEREATAEATQRDTESRQEQLQRRTAELERAGREFTDAQKQLGVRQQDLERSEKEFSARQTQLALELKELEAVRSRLESDTKSLQARLETEAKNLQAEQETLRQREEEVARSESGFATRDQALTTREQDVTRSEAEFAATRERLAAERADINRLVLENKSIVDEAKSAESRIEASRLEGVRIEQELAARRADLAAFEQAIKQREQSVGELETALQRREDVAARREEMFKALGMAVQTGGEAASTEKLIADLIARKRGVDEREGALAREKTQLEQGRADLANSVRVNDRERTSIAEVQQRLERERNAVAESTQAQTRERKSWDAQKQEQQKAIDARIAQAHALGERLLLREAVQNVLAETPEKDVSPAPILAPVVPRKTVFWPLALGATVVCALIFVVQFSRKNSALRETIDGTSGKMSEMARKLDETSRQLAETSQKSDETLRKSSLVVVADQPNVQISIPADPSRPAQGSLATFHDLGAGSHKVRAVKDGYQPEERTVVIRPGVRVTVENIVLRPATLLTGVGKGSVYIQSNPSGAKVKPAVDGIDPQETPALFKNLPAGNLTFDLVLDKYVPKSVKVLIDPNKHGEPPVFSLEAFGGVSVTTVPEDATVTVNGKSVQRRPGLPAVFENLQPGPVTIAVSRAGFDSREQSWTVKSGSVTSPPVVELKKIPPVVTESPKVEPKVEPRVVEQPKVIRLDLPERLNLESVPIRLVRIEPRTFPVKTKEGESIEIKITRPFLIGTTEITQSQFEAIMRSNPSHLKSKTTRRPVTANPYITGGPSGKEEPLPNNPVESVTWAMAMEFCQQLTQREKARGKLPEAERAVFRLPTDAEWWAASTSASAALSVSSSDGLEWFAEKGKEHRLVMAQPRDDRVYDLFGNVAEWCFDAWSDSLPQGGLSDPLTVEPSFTPAAIAADAYSFRRAGTALGRHVVNGGSFRDPAAAGRFSRKPGSGADDVTGFRIVFGYPVGPKSD